MLSIAGIEFDSPYVLAPLAGYTDLPFRQLCREYGAGFCVSEMISCHGLCYGQERTLSMMQSVESERPVSFQLFGAVPELMARGAAIMCEHAPDMIDLNMGCPVKKVTKRGAGVALMATPKLAEEIIRQVVAVSNVPVTVKFRAGVDSKNVSAVEFGLMCQQAGAAAVTVHGRNWAQGFTGLADRQIIAAVSDALTIPVIGNGDIIAYQQAQQMIEETGCDGVMIGRGALGNPWVFSKSGRPDDLKQIVAGGLRHMQLMEQYLPVTKMIGCIKNHIGRYFRGLPGSSAMRKSVYESADFKALKRLLATCNNATG